MKKLVRVDVDKDVFAKFDQDVGGRRSAAVAACIAKNRDWLILRSQKQPIEFVTISTLVDEGDIALLKKVARIEGKSLAQVVGELLVMHVFEAHAESLF